MKTQLLRVSRSAKSNNQNTIMFANQNIPFSDTVNIFGVVFSSDMKLDVFFPQLYKKLCRANSLTFRLGAAQSEIVVSYFHSL